jgi:hypothetical protein
MSIVSVTCSLQIHRDAAALTDLAVMQLKAGELHLRLDSKPRGPHESPVFN